jgi:hypothetical protein
MICDAFARHELAVGSPRQPQCVADFGGNVEIKIYIGTKEGQALFSRTNQFLAEAFGEVYAKSIKEHSLGEMKKV